MKQCKKEGCYNNIFGGGYCSSHQYLRTDKKISKKITFRSQKKPIQDFSFGFDSQVALFDWCWENALNKQKEVICPYTGEKLNKYLNTDMYYQCFAHILPKGRYTYFKYNPKNIEIVYPIFHSIADFGTIQDRLKYPQWKWEDWDNKVIFMKEEYIKYKIKNLLS